MKFLKPRNFLTFALAALSGSILMHTSQSVQKAEEKYERLQASVEHEQERLHLLKAEWQSLNRPERLEKLAEDFLDLMPPTPDTIVDNVSVLPEAVQDVPEEMLRDEAPQTILQPVVLTAPPSPPKKPEAQVKSSAPAEKVEVAPLQERSFDELMKELGEAQ